MHNQRTRLFAATFTPLHEDGTPALSSIPSLVDHLTRDGVDGLYVLGSTGEGTSLTSAERRQVAEAYVEAARGRLLTVVQVGHNSLAEARQLAAHAQRIGADAISAMPPSYFKPEAVEALVECLAMVADGAPELPFYYYHIPAMTGVEVDAAELLRVGAGRLPMLAGIKFSDPRVHKLQQCRQVRDGAYDLFFGVDEMLLSGLVAGANGAVGTTYNFAAPLYRRMIDAYEQGDLERARHCQERANAMVDVILHYCGRAGLKAMMNLMGHDCGPHRLPLQTARIADVEAMREALEEIGFFDWGRAVEPARPAPVIEQPLKSTLKHDGR